MLLKITGTIYLDASDDADIEAVARVFDQGFEAAVMDFPAAEVVQADVERIERVSDDEVAEKGLVE